MSHRETLRAAATGWSHADAIRGVLEELERAEADARDARIYVAEVAQGITHYPHGEGEPCVRCAKEQLEERVRVCLQVNEELGKELLAAERGGKRQDGSMSLDLTLTRWRRLLRALGFAWRSVESCCHPAERARSRMDPDPHVVCLDCGAFLFFALLGLTEEGERSGWAKGAAA